jgi:hypothetical protein
MAIGKPAAIHPHLYGYIAVGLALVGLSFWMNIIFWRNILSSRPSEFAGMAYFTFWAYSILLTPIAYACGWLVGKLAGQRFRPIG